MSAGRRDSDNFHLPPWAVALLPIVAAGLLALGAAKVTVGGKEDASTHAMDISDERAVRTAAISTLTAAVREAENQRDKDFIRDSAWKADAMRILLDVQRQVKK